MHPMRRDGGKETGGVRSLPWGLTGRREGWKMSIPYRDAPTRYMDETPAGHVSRRG